MPAFNFQENVLIERDPIDGTLIVVSDRYKLHAGIVLNVILIGKFSDEFRDLVFFIVGTD